MIRWEDADGMVNILVLDPIDFGPPPEPIEPHRFQPAQYLHEPYVGPCWCNAPQTHPIHKED